MKIFLTKCPRESLVVPNDTPYPSAPTGRARNPVCNASFFLMTSEVSFRSFRGTAPLKRRSCTRTKLRPGTFRSFRGGAEVGPEFHRTTLRYVGIVEAHWALFLLIVHRSVPVESRRYHGSGRIASVKSDTMLAKGKRSHPSAAGRTNVRVMLYLHGQSNVAGPMFRMCSVSDPSLAG